MDRHRKIVNDRLDSFGLPKLPRGPKHTIESEALQRARGLSMRPGQSPFSTLFHFNTEESRELAFAEPTIMSNFFPTGVAAAGNNRFLIRDPSRSSPNDEETRPQAGNNVSGYNSNHHLSYIPRACARFDDSDMNDGISPFELSDRNYHSTTDFSSADSSAGLESESGGDERHMSGDEMTDVTRMNTSAFLRFDQWAQAEKEWVRTFIEFGVTDRLLARLLKLKNAPFVSITLKRNFLKYSGLRCVKYMSCNGHMLIEKEFSRTDTPGNEVSEVCTVCSDRNTKPKPSTFEYFELLPRIKSWVRNEKSCRTLFSYRHEHIKERVESPSAYGPGVYYADMIDGELFRRIANKCGGLEGTAYDITLAVSCDGFQTFRNDSYDCWPIVALNHNLPPSMRFLIHNLIPLGFIKGPKEPVLLDTFLIPLLEEVTSINENGGSEILFFDGVRRTVRVHIVVFTGDSPAVAKLAGTTGSNWKSSCRLCNHQGCYCSSAKHYYFPSKVRIEGDESVRAVWKRFYDIKQLDLRSPEAIESTLLLLERNREMSNAERVEIQKETGIKKRTVPLRFPSIVPFASFPLDTMHLCMNICKDFTQILRGENRTLSARIDESDGFVISQESLTLIDKEIAQIGRGTSLSSFGVAPRATSEYRKWKAAECRDFYRWYAVILFEGHISPSYLKGIRMLSAIFERCSWPTLSQQDVDDLNQLSRDFVHHYETKYFRYDSKRVSICKSTIHALLHLARVVELCGPLVNVNQFWVERYVGAVKHKLNATILPAESLTENAKFFESYKMYYGEHFAPPDDDTVSEDTSERCELLAPCDTESFNDRYHIRGRTINLLVDYLCRYDEISETEARNAIAGSKMLSYGRIRVQCGDTRRTFGAMKGRRHRADTKRADFYASCEFPAPEGEVFNVYYGRILKILRIELRLADTIQDCTVLIIDWAHNMNLNQTGQVYKTCRPRNTFTKATAESPYILSGSIGVLQHKVSGAGSLKMFFLDADREVQFLLDPDRTGPDGRNRILCGLREGQRG